MFMLGYLTQFCDESLDSKRCVAMEQVAEYKWEDIVRYASEVGLFGYSVRPAAVQRNGWVIGMALCNTWC